MIEIWKSIPGYDGLYEVSSLGNVRSLSPGKNNRWKNVKHPRNLSPIAQRGYRFITLWHHGKAKQYKVARLVLMAFHGLCPAGCESAHLNGRGRDDRLENLIWTTHRENINHKILHGTIARGESSGNSVLTEEQVLEIKKLLKQKTRKWNSLSNAKIARTFRVAENTIQAIDTGKNWGWLTEEAI